MYTSVRVGVQVIECELECYCELSENVSRSVSESVWYDLELGDRSVDYESE